MQTIHPAEGHKMYGIAVILAPLLLFISSFFWEKGEYGVTGGTLLILSSLFWTMALIFLFGILKGQMPNYAAWGLLVAVYGFLSGALFGFVGVFAEIFNISHDSYIEGFSRYPTSSGILLFWPGPLAPLSLVVLGINLLRTRSVRFWVGLMMVLGGIAFPLSRIQRIEWIAHLADSLLLVPLVYPGGGVLFASRRQS
jgi:hypothetical protein